MKCPKCQFKNPEGKKICWQSLRNAVLMDGRRNVKKYWPNFYEKTLSVLPISCG